MSHPDWSVRGGKRFTSEKQIIAEIEKCHANSKRALEKAESIDLQIRQHRDIPANEEEAALIAEKIRQWKSEARKWRNYATNQVEKKARKLGEKLSEFRTSLMPFETDASIPRSLR